MDDKKFVLDFYEGKSDVFNSFMYLWDDDEFKKNFRLVYKLFPRDASFLNINNPAILYNITLVTDKILKFYGWDHSLYTDMMTRKVKSELSRVKVSEIIFDDEQRKEIILKFDKPLMWDNDCKNFQVQFLIIKSILRFLNNVGLSYMSEIFFLAMCKSRNRNVDWGTFTSWLDEMKFIPKTSYGEIKNNIMNLKK